MGAIYKPFVLVVFFLIAGCTIKHDYIWVEYPITPERLNLHDSFDESKEIRISMNKRTCKDAGVPFGKKTPNGISMHDFRRTMGQSPICAM